MKEMVQLEKREKYLYSGDNDDDDGQPIASFKDLVVYSSSIVLFEPLNWRLAENLFAGCGFTGWLKSNRPPWPVLLRSLSTLSMRP